MAVAIKFNLVGIASFFLFALKVSAAPRPKTVTKILAGCAAILASAYFGTYAQQLQYSDESLDFWKHSLHKRLESDLLFKLGWYPSFIIEKPYQSTGKTLFLDSLPSENSHLLNKLLEAGSNPNAVDKEGHGFFHHSQSLYFPISIAQTALLHGLDVNKRNSDNKLPLDVTLAAQNYAFALLIVNAGAQSDFPWSSIVYDLADDNVNVTTDPTKFATAPIYGKHRLILAIYRAAGKDSSIVSSGIIKAIADGNGNMLHFLSSIDAYNEILSA